MEFAFERVGLQARIERMISKEEISLCRETLKRFRKFAEGAFEVRSEGNLANPLRRARQDMSSFNDCTDRVLPS